MRILSRGRIGCLTGSFLFSSSALSWRTYSTRLASVDIVSHTPKPTGRDPWAFVVGLRLPERHAEGPQQLARLVVTARTGDKGDVHALSERHLVGIDFGEDRLLRQAEAVVAVAVEALGVDAAEVANTRQGNADQAIQKLVHAAATQGHAAADLVTLAQTEAADRDLGLADLGALAGDLRQLLGGLLHAALVLQRLADAHVDDDLLQP